MEHKAIKISTLSLVLMSMVGQNCQANAVSAAVTSTLTKNDLVVAPLTLSQSLGKLIMTYPKTCLGLGFFSVMAFIAAVAPEKPVVAAHTAIPDTFLPAGTHAQVIRDVWSFDNIARRYYRDQVSHSFAIPDQVWQVRIPSPHLPACPPVLWRHAGGVLQALTLNFTQHTLTLSDDSRKTVATAFSQFSGLNSAGQLVRTSVSVEVDMDGFYWVYTFRVSRKNMSLDNPQLYDFEKTKLVAGGLPWQLESPYVADERRGLVLQADAPEAKEQKQPRDTATATDAPDAEPQDVGGQDDEGNQ